MSRFVIAALDDMVFISKIRGTAEHLGIDIRFPRNVEAVFETARAQQPDLIIVDLHAQKIDPILLANKLNADPQLQSTELLGFVSHVETELMRAAKEAGYDRVMPRSAFTKDLAIILAG